MINCQTMAMCNFVIFFRDFSPFSRSCFACLSAGLLFSINRAKQVCLLLREYIAKQCTCFVCKTVPSCWRRCKFVGLMEVIHFGVSFSFQEALKATCNTLRLIVVNLQTNELFFFFFFYEMVAAGYDWPIYICGL